MTNPVINISRTWDAVGRPKWQASVTLDDNFALFDEGSTPIDALHGLATRLATLMQREREARRQEQEEARLQEQR